MRFKMLSHGALITMQPSDEDAGCHEAVCPERGQYWLLVLVPRVGTSVTVRQLKL